MIVEIGRFIGAARDALMDALGFLIHARLKPIELNDLSATHSSRPARLVLDVGSPARFVPSEIRSASELDAQFEKYWNRAVMDQQLRADESLAAVDHGMSPRAGRRRS